ncbi:MYXO-CTERM domain-containing protein [Inhella inkyongensis]|uniref:MYXO-CTERM domain-containing protein n=1 Tax=Inhella inkyongensis TaxID=392593 RepID=A0A840S7Z9_9BURK|nr:PEP-CTERM sorting domain-containing protein [Inhella inkyongensis]MBB5205136.1 MYXO-CTERM domain-containing protein [Inhella inkyongensis]
MTIRTRWAALLLAAACSGAAQAAPAPYTGAGEEAPAPGPLVATQSGQLVVYFSGLAGGYDNWLGVLVNGQQRPLGLSNQTSTYGQSFSFGQVSAGDSLNFFIQIGNEPGETEVERYYSDISWNLDGVNHAFLSDYSGDNLLPAGQHLAFEDLDGGGDFNYADHGFVYRIEQVSAVPEPGSALLALAGLGVIGTRLRRRRAD